MKEAPEVWRVIENRPANNGRYEVSNRGEIRHVFPSGRIRKLTPYRRKTNTFKRRGSDKMLVHLNGYAETVVHRIVWETFVGPVPDEYRIIHKDGLKENNRLENLCAVPVSELGRRFGAKTERSRHRKRDCVVHVDRDGRAIAFYASTREAEAGYKYLNRQSINDRCNGKIKNPILPDGTTFMWEEDYERKYG